MGNLQMKLVVSIANLTKNCKSSKKQVVVSCISLILATMILISSVYCWFFLQQAKTLGTFSIDASNGLRLNYNNNNSSVVQIKKNMNFLPVSSVNGQNLYFPSDGSFFKKDTLEKKTKEITYRSATAGDKNIYFLQFDFVLTSFSDNTEVYIDDTDTYVRNKTTLAPINAMRVAFLYDNGKHSVVMNPTKKENKTKAVDVVNFGTGKCISTAEQVSQPFSYYTAANNQSLFTLKEGEKQTMSVVVWLEGTDENCKNSIIGSNIDINIKFTTTANNTDVITFKDVSDGWISNLMKEDGSTLQLVYKEPLGTPQYVKMTGSGTEFTCKIQKTIDRDITFVLTTADGKPYTWQQEPDLTTASGTKLEGGPSTYRGKNVIYYAKGTKEDPEKDIPADPRGYWKTTDGDNDIETDVPKEEW